MGYISESIGNLEHEQKCSRQIADLKAENAELRRHLANAVKSALEIREMLDPGGNLSIKDAVAVIKSKWPNEKS